MARVLGMVLAIIAVWAVIGPVDGGRAQPAGGIPPEMIKALEAEKPLGQADIDVFVRILPEFTRASQASSEAALKILGDAGLSEVRMAYVFSKISIGVLMNNDLSLEKVLEAQGVPKVLRPTAADLKLIEKNKGVLEKAFSAVDVQGR